MPSDLFSMLDQRPDRFDLRDATTYALTVAGKTFIADITGGLYWPAQHALIVADLHLEKASAAAARGRMLPPYDTRETLSRLAEAIDRFEPAMVIALGDSLHDRGAALRIADNDLAILGMAQEGRRWIWVTGNHDPVVDTRFGGEVCAELEIEGVTLRHEPHRGRISHEIAGHLHPAAKVSRYGHAVRRPCFLGNGRRLILPAFGAFAGGLNVLDPVFEPLFGADGLQVTVLGQEGVYPIATRRLIMD
jgi:DNA ligase-associated metallophosphoesterase